MKVLYHHRVASKDGQYVHIHELQSALRKLGHEIVTVEPSQYSQRSFGMGSGVASGLRDSVPAWAAEVLETGYSCLDYARLHRAIVKHKPDCIYERYNLFTPSGAWARRRFGLPLLVEVNAPLFHERSAFGGISLKSLARWSERTVWRSADYVLPVTDVLAGFVERAGVTNDKIKTIPNGVNLEEFRHDQDQTDLRRSLGITNRTVLGFTGFAREWHGLERAVDIVATSREAQPVHLLIVGDGPGCELVRQRASELDVSDRVTITGVVARSRMASYIATFDIALQPAVVDYASPLKLFEYLAMAKPIVAPDKPNIREILTDGENALLFDPNDQDSFGRAVRRLCEDPALRQALGDAARRLIFDRKLTWDANAERVIELFESLDSNGAGRDGVRAS